jgi:site-specific recombinase XerC
LDDATEGRIGEVAVGYGAWLAKQPLSENTKRAYRTRAKQFLEWLESTAGAEYGDALSEAHARDYAVRDFKAHLKTVAKAKPSSVNLSLAAIDSLYRYLGMGRPDVRREELPAAAPRALPPDEQKRFLRAVDRCPSARDRAVATLFFYSALRLEELAGLDVDDVAISARKGRVVVRSGKGDAYREVALNAEVREALDGWTSERRSRFGGDGDRALFVGREGKRLTARAVDLIVRRLGGEPGRAALGARPQAHLPDEPGEERQRPGDGRRDSRAQEAGDHAPLQPALRSRPRGRDGGHKGGSLACPSSSSPTSRHAGTGASLRSPRASSSTGTFSSTGGTSG